MCFSFGVNGVLDLETKISDLAKYIILKYRK